MSSEQEPPIAVFDRVFNSISRARRELSNSNSDNLLSSTRRLFRRQVQRNRPPGRQENPVWQTHLFLLPGPDVEVLPSTSDLERFGNLGLGRPVQESSGTGAQKSKIQLNWTLYELNNFVCQCYPNVSLNLIGFHLARAGKGRKIQKVHVNSVWELKKAVGKSRLYIVPRAEVMQVITPSPSMSQNPVQTSSTAATPDDISLGAQTTQAVHFDSLQEWRAIRSQQDEEYNASLLADQEKDRRRQCYELLEQRRIKAIEERRQRMAAHQEHIDGEFLKFKYPDGYVNKRKFIMSEPIQVLFDFIGQNEMASEVFKVQEAASSKAIESTSSGSIADHGIRASSTLYVLWMPPLDNLSPAAPPPIQPPAAPPPVQPPAAQPPVQPPAAQPPVQPPAAQPPAAQPPVQPPAASRPVFSGSASRPVAPPPVQSSVAPRPAFSGSAYHPVAPPPVQSPVAQPPVQSPTVPPPVHSPVTPPPVQSPVAPPFTPFLVALPLAQPPVSQPSIEPPLSPPSLQQSIIYIKDEPAPSAPSPLERIIDLLDVAPSPFQHESPLHYEAPVDEVDLQTVLTKLLSKVDKILNPTSNQINVCRDRILQCSLQAFKRRNFNPEAKLDIVFVDADENGEGAVDEGGPTREYLRLLMRAIHQSSIFQGHEKDRSLALDTHALQNKLYTFVGKMIAVCIVHGGVGPHFFSERLYQQICGMRTSPASVDEIGDHTFREQLIKIQETTTVLEANSAITEAADSLSIIGALRYIANLQEKDSLVQSAVEFFVNGRLQAALDQFVEGLQTLGLLEEIQKNSVLFYDMFVNEEKPLQAKDLCSLFKVNFSLQGSNRRARENSTICHWRDWLIDIEEGECDGITLEMLMEFATGASTVPPLGFPHSPQIRVPS